MKRLPALPVFALVVLACGQVAPAATAGATPTATAAVAVSAKPTPSASASAPTAGAGPLFAVLEAKAHPANTWDTVAIAGLDGFARAKATFDPVARPWAGNCGGFLMPSSAQAVAGAVFFADGAGIVRRLSVGGDVVQVAAFPRTSGQQIMSIAVSPDGARVLAAILTLPPKPAVDVPCYSPIGDPNKFGPGDWAEDVYVAEAGNSPKLLSHVSWHQDQRPDVLDLVRWDGVGPLGDQHPFGLSMGVGPIGPGLFQGKPVRVDPDTGKVVNRVAVDCAVGDVGRTGSLLCWAADGSAIVYRSDGTELWRWRGPQGELHNAKIGPDDRAMVVSKYDFEAKAPKTTLVVAPGSSEQTIGTLGSDVAWIDSHTVMDRVGSGAPPYGLSYISLEAPDKVVALGFPGLFVGTVQGG